MEITFPEDLPIAQHREQIAQLVAKHPVTIVCGETGSGKTTQLPKISLAIGRGRKGLIGCTQPRRIAARSLSNRLAQELPAFPKGFVGHKIRFQDATRRDTVIKVMTDGILLAETHSDRELRAYDTIIVDEAHERSLNVDFLLGYMKRLVKIRPELKVIVTSATIDTERFSQFFDGAPVIEVSGRTYPVEVRYRPEFFEPESPLDGVARKAEDDEPVDMP
jgi:ATP-dependent helicase HrpA